MKKNYYIFTCTFFFGLGGNILGFSLIYRLTDWYSFSPGQIGTFIALGQFSYFLGCNLYHRFGSSFNPVKVFTVASAVVLLVVLPLSFVKVLGVAYVSYWVLSLFSGLFWPPIMAWLTGGLNDKELSREISIFNRSWTASNIVGPLIAGNLYRWNSTSAFIALCISYSMVITLLFLMRRHSKEHGTEAEMNIPGISVGSASAGTDSAQDHLKSQKLKALDRKLDLFRYRGWLCGFCSAMFLGIMVNITPLHIRDGLGYTERAAGMILFFRCVMTFAGFTLLARFTAWQFSRRWFLILHGMLIFCAFLLLFAGSRFPLFFVVVFIYGLINSGTYNGSIFYSGATGRNPKKNLALHEIFLCIGNAIGTAGGGFIYQQFRYAGMALALIMILSLGLGASILLERRQDQ